MLTDAPSESTDWDHGLSPRLGPKSMRADDAPYAELTPDYTPGQGDTLTSTGGPNDRLPYTQVVQQVHARMADSPILRAFLTRRPGRVRRIVRPPFARLADLPPRTGVQKAAEVPVGKWDLPPDQGGTARRPSDDPPPRYRDPRNALDIAYDMRMPPYMRHSMGVPLAITRRQYDLLMAYLDRLETDPRWQEPANPAGARDD
jgi:hypothetical protein